MLEGLKRKSSWLHEAYAPYWASFFFLTRQGDLIGFSAAEGVLSAKGEAAGVLPSQRAATSRVLCESQQPLPMWISSHARPRVKNVGQHCIFFRWVQGKQQVHDNESKQTSKQQERG